MTHMRGKKKIYQNQHGMDAEVRSGKETSTVMNVFCQQSYLKDTEDVLKRTNTKLKLKR